MFDSGICTICDKTEASIGGLMPQELLVPKLNNVYFGTRSISYSRMYEARGADSQIDKLIRVPEDVAVAPDDYIIIGTDQFRVDAVNDVIVRRSTRARELSLIKLEDLYNVADTTSA